MLTSNLLNWGFVLQVGLLCHSSNIVNIRLTACAWRFLFALSLILECQRLTDDRQIGLGLNLYSRSGFLCPGSKPGTRASSGPKPAQKPRSDTVSLSTLLYQATVFFLFPSQKPPRLQERTFSFFRCCCNLQPQSLSLFLQTRTSLQINGFLLQSLVAGTSLLHDLHILGLHSNIHNIPFKSEECNPNNQTHRL